MFLNFIKNKACFYNVQVQLRISLLTLLIALVFLPIVALPLRYHFIVLGIAIPIAIAIHTIHNAKKTLAKHACSMSVLDRFYSYGIGLLGTRYLVDQQVVWQLLSIALCYFVFLFFEYYLYQKLKTKNSLIYPFILGISVAVVLFPLMLLGVCSVLVIDALIMHSSVI